MPQPTNKTIAFGAAFGSVSNLTNRIELFWFAASHKRRVGQQAKDPFNKSRWIRQFLAIAMIVGTLPTTVGAMSLSEDPLHLFAQCAGRLEAESDFAQAWDAAAYARVKSRHSNFLDLVAAVRTAENGKRANQLQVQAKIAHMSLLWRAQMAFDPNEASIATRSAARDVAFCLRMLPS